MNEIATMGAGLRAHCAAEGKHRTANIWATDTLHVHLHRYGQDWQLELSDEKAIDADTIGAWLQAVGAPEGADWLSAFDGRGALFAWEDTAYEPAPDVAGAYWQARP
jgi:hypothetical protein